MLIDVILHEPKWQKIKQTLYLSKYNKQQLG